jgi:hypothetical protein
MSSKSPSTFAHASRSDIEPHGVHANRRTIAKGVVNIGRAARLVVCAADDRAACKREADAKSTAQVRSSEADADGGADDNKSQEGPLPMLLPRVLPTPQSGSSLSVVPNGES